MTRIGATLELSINLDDTAAPATATIVLTREIRDASGRLKLTRDCASADELESEINVLQDELDELRRQAQRVFMVGA